MSRPSFYCCVVTSTVPLLSFTQDVFDCRCCSSHVRKLPMPAFKSPPSSDPIKTRGSRDGSFDLRGANSKTPFGHLIQLFPAMMATPIRSAISSTVSNTFESPVKLRDAPYGWSVPSGIRSPNSTTARTESSCLDTQKAALAHPGIVGGSSQPICA